MLELIGLGLFDEKDISLRGLEEARKADKVFIELYTGRWYGSLKKLERLIKKKIEILPRKDLEENSDEILKNAKIKKIVIFAQGDPMIATTHISLIQAAKKMRIKTKIIHNASIISAIGETGMHLYKFGPTVTIPFPERTMGKLPESVYDVIKMNKARGLHTLCLLDIIGEEKRYMQPKEAIDILLRIEDLRKESVFTKDSEVVVFAKAGSSKPLIIFGKVSNLLERKLNETPAVLVIPGALHFTEKEYVTSI